MTEPDSVDTTGWPIARFPSSHLRQEFLEQVRLWNRVEHLPHIEVNVCADSARLRFRSVHARPANIQRLIEAFGGFVERGAREVA